MADENMIQTAVFTRPSSRWRSRDCISARSHVRRSERYLSFFGQQCVLYFIPLRPYAFAHPLIIMVVHPEHLLHTIAILVA